MGAHLVLLAEAAQRSHLGHALDALYPVAQVPLLERAKVREVAARIVADVRARGDAALTLGVWKWQSKTNALFISLWILAGILPIWVGLSWKYVQIGSRILYPAALGVGARVLPMSDDRVATTLLTAAGRLGFQEYFVGRRHQDAVLGVELDGIEAARPAPGVLDALTSADVVVLGPSNPFVSIGPILAVPGAREALAGSTARRVAVSPVVGGRALKGPAAAMLASLGHDVSALGVARLYAGLVDVFVVDEEDAALAPAIAALGMRVATARTVMGPGEDRARLARDVLAAAKTAR